MQAYDFLTKEEYFKEKRETSDSFEYVFEIAFSNRMYRHHIVIPKIYNAKTGVYSEHRKSTLKEFTTLCLEDAPSWFQELLKKTKVLYAEKNKVRALFHPKKEIRTILNEILLFDLNDGEANEMYERFIYNGILWTKDSGIYEDITEALLVEGYEVDSCYEDGLYKIDIIED